MTKNPREIIQQLSPNHNVLSTIKFLPWPIHSRQFIYESTWTKLDDYTYIYAWRPPASSRQYDRLVNIGRYHNSRLIKGEARGFVVLRDIGHQKCEVNYVHNIDAKGRIPIKLMDTLIPRSLSSVFQMRKTFNRDDELDQISRDKLVAIMKQRQTPGGGHSEEEIALVERISHEMGSVADDQFTKLNSPDFRTAMSQAYIVGESSTIMKVEVIIDASVEECAAYTFECMSRKRMKINDKKSILMRDAKNHNDYSLDFLSVRDFGFGLRPRRMLLRHVWKRVGGEKIVHVFEDIKESDVMKEVSE